MQLRVDLTKRKSRLVEIWSEDKDRRAPPIHVRVLLAILLWATDIDAGHDIYADYASDYAVYARSIRRRIVSLCT